MRDWAEDTEQLHNQNADATTPRVLRRKWTTPTVILPTGVAGGTRIPLGVVTTFDRSSNRYGFGSTPYNYS